MEKKIVLGIDQGLANCGISITSYKVYKDNTVKFDKLLYKEYIKTTTNNSLENRVLYIYIKIEEVINTYNPDFISCEKLFFSPVRKNNRNMSSSIIPTNMITGIIYLLAAKHEIFINDFTPGTIKKIITGNGKANKDLMMEHISLLVGEEINNEHISDSIGIGYTSILKYYEEIKEGVNKDDKK